MQSFCPNNLLFVMFCNEYLILFTTQVMLFNIHAQKAIHKNFTLLYSQLSCLVSCMGKYLF